jgi:hypothetical protein
MHNEVNTVIPCEEIMHFSHLKLNNFGWNEQYYINFRSRRWGSSITACARLTVHSSPHGHERKFSGARVCRVTFKHLPQPLRIHILSFGTLGQIFKIPPFSAQKSHSAGGRGVPQFFLGWNPNILLLRSPCKISKPYNNPFWEN